MGGCRGKGNGRGNSSETALEESRKETADRVATFRVNKQVEPIYAVCGSHCFVLSWVGEPFARSFTLLGCWGEARGSFHVQEIDGSLHELPYTSMGFRGSLHRGSRWTFVGVNGSRRKIPWRYMKIRGTFRRSKWKCVEPSVQVDGIFHENLHANSTEATNYFHGDMSTSI